MKGLSLEDSFHPFKMGSTDAFLPEASGILQGPRACQGQDCQMGLTMSRCLSELRIRRNGISLLKDGDNARAAHATRDI